MKTQGEDGHVKTGDWSDVSISQGLPKLAPQSPEARGQAWNRFFLTALKMHQPCQNLDLGLLASRTVIQYICCLRHPVCGTLLQHL